MLGYVLGCALWGAAKASILGVHRAPGSHALTGYGPEIVEELQFRLGLERVVAPRLNIAPEPARIAQAALFGLIHPGTEVDAALGGYVYSKAYDAHGLLGALAAHTAHNIGVWLGSS